MDRPEVGCCGGSGGGGGGESSCSSVDVYRSKAVLVLLPVAVELVPPRVVVILVTSCCLRSSGKRTPNMYTRVLLETVDAETRQMYDTRNDKNTTTVINFSKVFCWMCR